MSSFTFLQIAILCTRTIKRSLIKNHPKIEDESGKIYILKVKSEALLTNRQAPPPHTYWFDSRHHAYVSCKICRPEYCFVVSLEVQVYHYGLQFLSYSPGIIFNIPPAEDGTAFETSLPQQLLKLTALRFPVCDAHLLILLMSTNTTAQ